MYIKFSGGNREEVTPVPISNTAVKLFIANGTALAAEWESRSPPEINFLGDKSNKGVGAKPTPLLLFRIKFKLCRSLLYRAANPGL